MAPAGTDRPFVAYSPDSFFRRPLPAMAPISATSAEGIRYAKANNSKPYPTIRGVQGNPWGQAFAIGRCTDPIWKISATGSVVPASQRHLRDVGFHAPEGWAESIPDNSDAPFLVIDRCGTAARPGGLSVWGANAAVSGRMVVSGESGTLAVGSFAHDTNGLDRRNPRTNSRLNERSRGCIPDAMVIRDDLLDWAIANNTGLGHVLHMFWNKPDSIAGVVHPMVGCEKPRYGYGAQGERIRVKASVDLDARKCNPVGRAIAKTLQQHGAYLGDTSGGNSGFKAQQGSTYPGLTIDVLKGCVTWDDMEFIQRGWDG